jgi:hypothetical protein
VLTLSLRIIAVGHRYGGPQQLGVTVVKLLLEKGADLESDTVIADHSKWA